MIINGNSYNTTSNRMVLLWENDDTTVEFSSITLDIKPYNYKMLYVMFYGSTSLRRLYTQLFVPKSGTIRLACDYGKYRYHRVMDKNGSYLRFRIGQYTETGSDGNSSVNSGDKYIIPYRIYGVY